jgi:hypothetical protein
VLVVVVVVRPSGQKRKGRGRVWAKNENPKTEPLQLRFGWIRAAGAGVGFCGGHRAPSTVA